MSQEHINSERYANALTALADAASCGVRFDTLQTMRFEMALDARDFDAIIKCAIKSKINLMEMKNGINCK